MWFIFCFLWVTNQIQGLKFFPTQKNLDFPFQVFWIIVVLYFATYSKSVTSVSSTNGVYLYWRFMIPNITALSGLLVTVRPSAFVYFFNWSVNHSTALAPIFVPRLRSNGVGDPPCCMWPTKKIVVVLRHNVAYLNVYFFYYS